MIVGMITPGYEYLAYVFGAGALLSIVSVVLIVLARSADRRNYIIQKATPMPLKLVNERDDVWVRGQADCERPLHAPHFGNTCITYHYTLEERVRETRRTKDGTSTRYSWKTRERIDDSVPFTLSQGDASVEVDSSRADFRDLLSAQERIGEWRHSLKYIPCPTTLSVVGSVGTKCATLQPYANIPLLVTPRTRAAFVAAAERGERLMRFFGFACLVTGFALLGYGLFDVLQWPVSSGADFRGELAVAGLLASGLITLPVWIIHVFNSLVTYRVRADNAWVQVDVDLKMRYDLIPRLVSSAKGYLEHERDVLQRLTDIRSQAVGSPDERRRLETQATDAVGGLQAVLENYPDLKSQSVVEGLMKELTAIEEKIAHGRTIFNEAVEEYNRNVLAFPRVLVARMTGFRAREFLGADTPKVDASK